MRDISRLPAAAFARADAPDGGGSGSLHRTAHRSRHRSPLKAIMYCVNCGLGNADTARFCVRCGVALAAASAQQPATYPPGTPYAQAATDPYGGAYQRGQPQYLVPPTQRGMQPATPWVPQKAGNPVVASVLSVIIPGLGQLYNGDVKKGLLMFFGAFIGLFMLGLGWLGMMIWSAIDAYQVSAGTGKRWD
ncbi:MAG TPA: zinc ribbon domain-containing protein [Longimicrobium sp.]|nr:zinc ribbon domain-containing protein [Longimicrobium sp.]